MRKQIQLKKKFGEEQKRETLKIGTVIVADIQTDAIGTHGRKWYTTKKDNIAFSFVVYPNIEISRLESLTVQIAKILVKVFEELYGIKIGIKQPNDLVIRNRNLPRDNELENVEANYSCYKKVGGILCETKLQGENVKCLVVGIGINTNQEEFENEIVNIATSIKNEYGIQVDNSKVIEKFCREFELELAKICK